MQVLLKGGTSVDLVSRRYMGGSAADAKYETVCSRDTGHVEVVHVHFDPKKVAGGLRGLLEVFYKAHDPTDGGGQGADRGP